jgi:hypothetical protein
VAVEDTTYLDINGKTLELNTPRNGAAYKQDNVRYHVYLARKEADIPEEVGKFALTCEKCGTGFERITQRKSHLCREDPENVERLRAGHRKRQQKFRENKKKRNKAEGKPAATREGVCTNVKDDGGVVNSEFGMGTLASVWLL